MPSPCFQGERHGPYMLHSVGQTAVMMEIKMDDLVSGEW